MLIVLGGAAVLVGLDLSAVFVGIFVHVLLERRLEGRVLAKAVLATSGGVLVCGGFAVLGARRVASGIRGHDGAPRASGRFEAWYRRNWYAAGLAAWIVWVVTGMVLSGPRAFFLVPDGDAGRFGWYALLVYLVLPLHVAAHELGHALAGGLVGFGFASVRVGWLGLRRADGRLQVFWERPATAEALGFHSAVPIGTNALGARLAAHAAAGPLVTLAVALACRAAASMAAPTGDTGLTVALASQALQVGSWTGIALAVINTAPLRTRSGFTSDGAIVLGALAPATPARRALLLFHSQWAHGRRPRDWGTPASEFVKAAHDAPADRDALLLAGAAVALDTGDERTAAEILRRALEAPGPTRSSMRYELELQAVLLDSFQGRAREARERLTRLGPHPDPRQYPLLAEAAVKLSEGDLAGAGAALDSWERAMESTGSGARIRVGNRWAVERLRASLAAREP